VLTYGKKKGETSTYHLGVRPVPLPNKRSPPNGGRSAYNSW